MKQYHKHLEDILKLGTHKKGAREGMPSTISLFGYQTRYDLSEGFPLLTTKKMNFKHIIAELLWFLKGDSNIKYLVNNGCNIWNEDAYNYYLKICKRYNIRRPIEFSSFLMAIRGEHDFSDQEPRDYKWGDTGQQYPTLWREWAAGTDDGFGNYYPLGEDNCGHIDQISELVEGLKNNPMSRRHIITAWNPATLDDMALNACHAFVQFNCREIVYQNTDNILIDYDLRTSEVAQKVKDLNLPKYYIDCLMYQRSADMFLGVPYNIASYALLTEILAVKCNMIVGDLIHTFGDSHIYENHMDQVTQILTRDPEKYPLVKLRMRNRLYSRSFELDELTIDDFDLEGYESYPAIKGKLSTGLK